MVNAMKSAIIKFELSDGSIVDLTLNFKKLLNVRNNKKDTYQKYNKIMMDGPKDLFDNVTILYTAYLCGLDDVNTAMSESEFIEVVPPYMQVVNQTVVDLTRPKKQTDSEKLLESEPESNGNE